MQCKIRCFLCKNQKKASFLFKKASKKFYTLFYYTIFFIKKQITLLKPCYGNQKASLAIDFAMKKFSRLAWG